MSNNLLKKVEEIYGSPSGFSEDRRKAYYQLNKEPNTVTKELKEIENNVCANFYVLAYGTGTVVSMDT